MSETERAKVSLELLFTGDGRTFLNYWDYIHGNDVTAQLIDSKLMLNEYDDAGNEVSPREITLSQFIEEVQKVI